MKEIKELLRKLEPVIGKRAKNLWYLNLFSKNAKEEKENKDLLRLLADKNAKISYHEKIRLPPPEKEKLSGMYKIGQVIYPERDYGEFGLREDEFIKHILIVGMTGTGKSNLSFHILKELSKQKKPFIVFDWKKSYRDLMQLKEFKDLKVIRLADKKSMFRFNPLIPPENIEPKHWMAMLIDVMKHAFFIGHGVEYFFRKGIDYLYEQYGIYEGRKTYPTFIDLESLLRKEYVKGREILWMSAAKRVLASLTFSGLLGEVLNERKQGNIKELLNEKVVIEM
ncbi:DUF87 domain-containing protein, partial [Caldithrix abyssi]|nr:DUF87 domain-containing protein [Caldithrix abyssi]